MAYMDLYAVTIAGTDLNSYSQPLLEST